MLSSATSIASNSSPISWGTWPVIITLLVAIISPFLTAYMNNRHNMKMKTLEIYTERKLNALQEYLASISAFQYNPAHEVRRDYGIAYGNVQIFLQPETANATRELDIMLQYELSHQQNFRSEEIQTLWDKVRESICDTCLTEKDKEILMSNK